MPPKGSIKSREITCPDCGNKFTPVNVNQRRCTSCIRIQNEATKQALAKAQWEERIKNAIFPDKGTPKYPPRPCKKCGKDFLPIRKDQVNCSECKNSVQHHSEKYKTVKIRCQNPECPLPDRIFEISWEKYRKGQRYCSIDCSKAVQTAKAQAKRPQPTPQEERPSEEVKSPYTPHDGGQREIHDDYKTRFRLINAGTRWGKDRCSINDFIRLFVAMLSENRSEDLVPRVHAWLVAPTFPLARQLWRELKYFFPPQWSTNKNEAEHQITTIMDGLIEVKSADNPDALVSVGLDLVLLTEAARVKDLETTWGYIRGRLSSPGRGLNGQGGSALVNSTPKGRNFFYTMYCWGLDPNMPDWKSYHHPTSDNPYINPKEVEEAKKTLPDRVFRQEFLAEFLSDSGDVFSNIDDVSTGIIQPPEPGMIYKAAWDPAMIADFSAFGIRNQRGEQVYLTRWTGVPWTLQLDKVEYYCKFYNNAPVEIDCTGSGASTFPEAVAQRGVQPIPQVFSNSSKEQWVSHLAMLLENRGIILLDKNIDDNTRAQTEELKSYTYTYTKTGKISYHHLPGQHDDCVSMLMLLYRDFSSSVQTLPYMGLLMGASRGGSRQSGRAVG